MSVLTLLLSIGCRVVEVPAPQSVPGILGPVGVLYLDDPVVDGDSVFGAFSPDERRIVLDRQMVGMFRRAMLAHERCHSALSDYGVVLSSEQEEHVCNAMAALEVAR